MFWLITNILLLAVTTVLLCIKWNKKRTPTLAAWVIGFFAYLLGLLFHYLIFSGVLPVKGLNLNGFLFVEQLFYAATFAAFYYSAAVIFAKRRIATVFLPNFILFAQVVLASVFAFAVPNLELSLLIQIVFFWLPVSALISLLFFKLFEKLREWEALLIALSFFIFAVSAPMHFVLGFNWYMIGTFVAALQAIGFIGLIKRIPY